MNKIFQNTAIYAIGEILPKIASFLLLPVFTRYLSTSEYGILSYTGSFMLLLSVIGLLALNSYALRFYFEYKTEENRRLLLGTVYMVAGISNLLLLLFGYLSFPAIIEKYNIQVPWDPYFKLALINNFLVSFNVIPLVIYRVRQDSAKFVALSFSSFLLTLLLNIFFVVYLKRGVLGYYQSTLIVSTLFFFIYIRIIWKYACFRISFNFLKEGLSYSLPLVPAAIAYFFLTLADRLILERNVPLSEIGIYNIAATLTGALGIVVQSGYHAVEPEIYNHYGTPEYYTFVKKAQTVYFSAIFMTAMAIALFSQEVFVLMTAPSFHTGYHLVPLLIIGAVMGGQNVIYAGVLSSEKRSKIQGVTSMIGAVFSFVFNLLVIPYLGTTAAAMSSMLAYILMNAILFIAMTFPGKNIFKEIIAVSLILIIPYFIFWALPEITFMSIIAKVIINLLYIYFIIKLFRVSPQQIKIIIKK